MQSVCCKNCNHSFKGNFCNMCGQSSTIEPIGLKYFIHDIPHSILHVDKGFWFTFKSLFTNPGKSIAEFLAGKRVNHYKPFAYVIILSAVYVFLSPFIEKLTEHLAGKKIYLDQSQRPFLEHYTSIVIFLLIPFLSITSWISFRKQKYNFWEHFLINTYLGAQTNILLLFIKIAGLIKILIGFSPLVNFTFAMFIFMTYYSFTFVGIMKPLFTNRSQITFRLIAMNGFIALIYITGFSLSGIMTPWWGN